MGDGHDVFGVDKRQNPWTDAFPTLLQDLAGHYPAFEGGIGGVEYPPADVVVHLPRMPRCTSSSASRTGRRERDHDLQRPRVRAPARAAARLLLDARGVRRRARFEEYAEEAADFAYTESPYSASKITSEAFIYSYARCYGLDYLVFRFSNVYGRYDNDLWRMERVLPLFTHQLARREPITIFGGDEKVLDFTYIDDCVDGIARGVYALVENRVTNKTNNLAYAKEHAGASRGADRGRARGGADITMARRSSARSRTTSPM